MKFIELHRDSFKSWIDIDKIVIIDEADYPDTPSCIRFVDNSEEYFIETPEEILQKIAEATRSERAEIFQKFVEAEQCERSFMDDWKRENDNG